MDFPTRITTIILKLFSVSAGWENRWVESKYKGSDAGKFKWTAGKFYGDAEKDKGRIINANNIYNTTVFRTK